MPYAQVAQVAHLQMPIVLHSIFLIDEDHTFCTPEAITMAISMHSTAADWGNVPSCMQSLFSKNSKYQKI